MQWKNTKSALGLDVGQSSVKAVLLEQKGKSLQISRLEKLSALSEGLLDEDELYASTEKWLKEHQLNTFSTCAAIPQYLTTPQISDFPLGIEGDRLNDMVALETGHLSGLSDEAFIHDYQPLPPGFGRENPVLIGVCRETVVNEQAARLQGIGVNLQDMAPSGLALVNALFYLHPQAKSIVDPQLLIEFGTETSSLAIVAGGQVLYASSLMFGFRRFAQGLATTLGCPLSEAERRLSQADPDWHDETSSFTRTLTQFDSELRNALVHWRESEKSAVGEAPLDRIWLAGGGALMPGLCDCFTRSYGCKVRILGIPQPDGSEDPALAVALGLALQAIGAGHCRISLIPHLLRWQQRKVARFKFLAAAAAVFFGGTLLLALWFNHYLFRELATLETQMSELRQCDSLVPRLDSAQNQIAHYQKMILPIVEAGSRPQRFLQTLAELHQAMKTDDPEAQGWCIYIADEFSYLAAAGLDKEPAFKETPGNRPANLFGNPAAAPAATPGPPEEKIQPVHSIDLLQRMLAGGFSPVLPNRGKYDSTRGITERLNAGNLFAGVDWLSDWNEAHAQQVFAPWQNYLRNLQSKNPAGNDVEFRMQLPFRVMPVRRPPPPVVSRGRATRTTREAR